MTTIAQANIDKANAYLKRFSDAPLGHFINGAHEAGSGETFDNTSPVDGAVMNQVVAGTPADIARAAEAAEAAFPAWKAMKGSALRGAANYRFYADKATEAANGLSSPAHDHMNYSIRQPIGPVGVITPWNTPFMLSTWKIAPALAAGCTVVHKPAEFSLIQAQGAPTLKRVHFELGGKNPVIVFDDADLDRALDAVVFMIYSLNGERCTSSSRLLVHRSIHDRFVEQVAERLESLRVGHPLDPDTEIGPLIHQTHFDKVRSFFDIAREDGAEIRTGGEPAGDGLYVKPTLFAGADNSMRIAQQGNLRARADSDPPSTTRKKHSRSPTISTTDLRLTSGRAIPGGRYALPMASKQAWSG